MTYGALRSLRRPILARRRPAGPLLQQVALRGGDAACEVEPHSAEQKALELARMAATLETVSPSLITASTA